MRFHAWTLKYYLYAYLLCAVLDNSIIKSLKILKTFKLSKCVLT